MSEEQIKELEAELVKQRELLDEEYQEYVNRIPSPNAWKTVKF